MEWRIFRYEYQSDAELPFYVKFYLKVDEEVKIDFEGRYHTREEAEEAFWAVQGQVAVADGVVSETTN